MSTYMIRMSSETSMWTYGYDTMVSAMVREETRLYQLQQAIPGCNKRYQSNPDYKHFFYPTPSYYKLISTSSKHFLL